MPRTLESRGYGVLQACNGQDALDRLERAGLVDAPLLPIIRMSGYTRDSAFGNGAGREHQAFLQKPVTEELLAKTLEEVLKARSRSGKPEALPA